MPTKLRRIFQKEYGSVRGKKIFYAWENKNHMLPRQAIRPLNPVRKFQIKHPHK